MKEPELKVGFSKFCEMKPRWCVTVGARGAHSVCVYSIHQNVKLMVTALMPVGIHEYNELLPNLCVILRIATSVIHVLVFKDYQTFSEI